MLTAVTLPESVDCTSAERKLRAASSLAPSLIRNRVAGIPVHPYCLPLSPILTVSTWFCNTQLWFSKINFEFSNNHPCTFSDARMVFDKNRGSFIMNLDYLIALKEKSGLTNEQIAGISGVPESTVTRIFSRKTDNPYFQTIVDIAKALDGSIDIMEGIQEKNEEIPSPGSEHRLIQLYREVIFSKNKWIKFLVAVLLIIVFIIIALLCYDILNPARGWIRY